MNSSVMKSSIENQITYRSSAGFGQFACAVDIPAIDADFKTRTEDFIVDECLPFELSGEGEHAWLHIQKRGCNTDWVAKQLAKLAGVRARDVGYAGLKDRHGVTSQWFSVHLPGKTDPDWEILSSDEVRILKVIRHSRKLRRGALKQNRFVIRLRGLDYSDQLEQRCRRVAEQGVPNYFGEQRFGHQMSNLESAAVMFSARGQRLPRHTKSLYLSAARSWIFNCILSERVRQGNWNRRLAGDVFMLDGKTACFQDDASPDLDQRLSEGEIHPTAVLWGEGDYLARGLPAELEKRIIDANPVFRDGLQTFRVQQMRRALRVIPREMSWEFDIEGLLLVFNLPAGSYATMVLRELVNVRDLGRQQVG